MRHLMSEEGEHQMLQDKQFSTVGETSNEDQDEGRTVVCKIEIKYCLAIRECDKARKVVRGDGGMCMGEYSSKKSLSC